MACEMQSILAHVGRLPFYQVLRIDGRIRDVKAYNVFIVSRIDKDTFLSTLFLFANVENKL